MAASYGSFSKFSLNGVRYDFDPSSTIGRKDEFQDTNGLRGTLQHSIERNLDNIYRVNGQLKTIPTALEMTTLLPFIYGQAAVTTTYNLAESVAGVTVVVDRVTKVHTYATVKPDRAHFHHQQGGSLGLDMDLVGTTETEASTGTFGTSSIDVSTKPWIFSQVVSTIGGSTFTPQSLELDINWNIDKDRFFNSQTLSTGTNATDLGVTFSATYPYGDSSALLTTHSVSTGVQVVLTWTNGVYILTHTLVKVALTMHTPEVNSRGEIMIPVSGTCFKSASTPPIVSTLATA